MVHIPHSPKIASFTHSPSVVEQQVVYEMHDEFTRIHATYTQKCGSEFTVHWHAAFILFIVEEEGDGDDDDNNNGRAHNTNRNFASNFVCVVRCRFVINEKSKMPIELN